MDSLPEELKGLFNKLSLQLYSNAALTENRAGAFLTTGDKCLDFFGSVVRDTSVATAVQGFLDAWNEDPSTAVKLILHLRDVRAGKGEKKLSLVLMYMLSCWKPLTYLANLERFLRVGSYKDLLFISEMAVRCNDMRVKNFKRIPQMDCETVELKIMACQLANDDTDLWSTTNAGISLCAKWAPTENTHFDHKPLRFARKITKAMGIKKSEYRLKLTKLRSHLNVLESLMSTEKYDEIVFKSLPSKAHRLYRTALHLDYNRNKDIKGERRKLAVRYKEYLDLLSKGKTTIKSTGVQPHELIQPYLRDRDKKKDPVIEGQWKDMISKLKETGHFKNVQAVCDVSDSMRGTPMEVAIALGLIVSELTDEPFKKKLITFSAKPKLHIVTGHTLQERVASVRGMAWGMNTDLIKVFEVLLHRAQKVTGAKMIEKLFIFTDMQFDEAQQSKGSWATTYDTICKMYAKTTFAVPKIIFWNLRATRKSFPVNKHEAGTALVSGFSAEMLKAFMKNKTPEFNPVSVMKLVLGKYEITPVPQQEHVPLPVLLTAGPFLEKLQAMVEEHLVAKKVPIPKNILTKRKRQIQAPKKILKKKRFDAKST